METPRQRTAAETLAAHGWVRYEPLSRGTLIYFRLPEEEDRQVRVGPGGGLKWLEKRSGGWIERTPNGSEEVGIHETLEALRAFDAQEAKRRESIRKMCDRE